MGQTVRVLRVAGIGNEQISASSSCKLHVSRMQGRAGRAAGLSHSPPIPCADAPLGPRRRPDPAQLWIFCPHARRRSQGTKEDPTLPQDPPARFPHPNKHCPHEGRKEPLSAGAHIRLPDPQQNAPCWSATSCSPTDYSAVPSALGGLTSGFGMGPGVPPLPWPLAGTGHSYVHPCPGGRTALGNHPTSILTLRASEMKSSAD